MWYGERPEDLPYKKLGDLDPGIFASYSGPDIGLRVVYDLILQRHKEGVKALEEGNKEGNNQSNNRVTNTEDKNKNGVKPPGTENTSSGVTPDTVNNTDVDTSSPNTTPTNTRANAGKENGSDVEKKNAENEEKGEGSKDVEERKQDEINFNSSSKFCSCFLARRGRMSSER